MKLTEAQRIQLTPTLSNPNIKEGDSRIEKTDFLLVGKTPYDEFEMEFAIPVVIVRTDWEEIARMMKQVVVILNKLPVDVDTMPDPMDIEIKDE